MGGHHLALLPGNLLKHVLGHGEHPAGSAGAVIEQVGGGLDPVGDGEEHQFCHEVHGVPGREVLPRLLVVVLIETPDQLLEDRSHTVVVQALMPHRAVGVHHGIRAQIDGGRGELLDHGAQCVGFGEARELVAELEVVEDVLDVRREAVQVILEVGFELLTADLGPQVVEGEPGGVVEGLSRRFSERGVLAADAFPVQKSFPLQHGLFAGFQHCIKAAQHRHGQDHVPVLAANVDIPQHIVRNAPDIAGNPGEIGCAGHGETPLLSIQRPTIRRVSWETGGFVGRVRRTDAPPSGRLRARTCPP